MTMYHECLGLIPPHHNTTMSVGSISKKVNVTGLCPRLSNFLQTSAISRELVDTEMAKVEALVEWETYNDTSNSIELTCTISHNMKNAQTMVKTWSKTASKTFLDVLANNFVSQQIETVDANWEPFMGCIGYENELYPISEDESWESEGVGEDVSWEHEDVRENESWESEGVGEDASWKHEGVGEDESWEHDDVSEDEPLAQPTCSLPTIATTSSLSSSNSTSSSFIFVHPLHSNLKLSA